MPIWDEVFRPRDILETTGRHSDEYMKEDIFLPLGMIKPP